VQVWSLARDVSPGTTLADADLRPARVRLFDRADAYMRVDRSPAGRVVTRQLRTGELLPVAALDTRPAADVVGIPVRPENAPGVVRGQLVDVWATTKGCAPVQILSGVAVQDVRASGGGALSVSTGAMQVIVRLPAEDARRVQAALGTESTIRLVVLDGVPAQRRSPAVPADSCALGAATRGAGPADAAPAGDSSSGAPLPPVNPPSATYTAGPVAGGAARTATPSPTSR